MTALGVEIIEIGGLNSIFEFKKYIRVRKIIRKWRPHIVHGAVFEGVMLATFGSIFNQVPILITEETSDPANRSHKATLLLTLLFKASNYTIGISEYVCEYLRIKAGVPEGKLCNITNGVQIPEMPIPCKILNVRQSLNISESDFVVGTVGRLNNDHKRFSDLIKAVEILAKHQRNIKLLIVGDGADKAMLQQLAEDLNVSNNILFAGFQHSPYAYYCNMDVFALVSAREGFGLAVVEAMFFKLPIVATNVGGMKNIVVNNETGYLVPPNRPEDIANALLNLYNDHALRLTLGASGYNRAMKNYTAETYTKKIEELYLTACRKRNIIK